MEGNSSFSWSDFIQNAQSSLREEEQGKKKKKRKDPKKKVVKTKKKEVPKKKTKRISKKLIKIKTPYFLRFTKEDKFIYDSTKYSILCGTNYNYNLLKLDQSELNYLRDLIKGIDDNLYDSRNGKYFFIRPDLINNFKSLTPVTPTIDPRVNYIQNKINNWPSGTTFTLKKLQEEYKREVNQKIGLRTISKILHNKLNLHYIKTTLKTDKILQMDNKRMAFFFIRNFVHAIKEGLIPIYVDETKIIATPQNYRQWRRQNQNIYVKVGGKKKKNLICAVTPYEILLFKFYDCNVNDKIYLKFMEELSLKIKGRQSKYFICSDNVSFHKSKKMMKAYWDLGLSNIFTSPYQSYFDAAEYVFRNFKGWIYKQSFPDLNTVEAKIKEVLLSDKMKKSLIKNYLHTLRNYLTYEEENINEDLDPNRNLLQGIRPLFP